jgi:hypothetical protein
MMSKGQAAKMFKNLKEKLALRQKADCQIVDHQIVSFQIAININCPKPDLTQRNVYCLAIN